MALFSEQDQLRDDEGIVTLMTMHNAKGLEYDTVFMIGLEDGVFPHLRAIEAGDVEEERRLCYVGITRARRELYLSHARSRSLFGGRDWNMRSRFIDEVPSSSRTATRTRSPDRPRRPPGAAARPRPPRPRPRERGQLRAGRGRGARELRRRAWSPGSSPAGSWWCASRAPRSGSERKLMADYAPLKKRG